MKFKERHNPKTEIKLLQSSTPTILIDPTALATMWTYVDHCFDEIGWLGTAHRFGQRTFYIDKVFLFRQEVHATTTEITTEGLSEFAEHLMQQEDGMETWNNLRVWGHSHVNMGVTPSSQDDQQMKTFADSGLEWFIRIIANKPGEFKVDFYNFTDALIYLDVPWEVDRTPAEVELEDQIAALYKQIDDIRNTRLRIDDKPIKDEMREKVKKKTYTYNYGTHYRGTQTQATTTPAVTITNSGGETNSNGNMDGDTIIINPQQALTLLQGGKKGNMDMLDEVEDVFHFFDASDLYAFAECSSIDQVRAEVRKHGFSENFFTMHDLGFLMSIGWKLAQGDLEVGGAK